ncbi:MAG: hypothetical protein U0Z44_07015 [Kouleothrix sp.]
MLETDRLPPSWVEQANQMDEVWTPSAWGAEVFRASGVARPVYVVPLGVDAARFQPAPPRTLLRDRTIFLSVFEWGERKGWEVLLRVRCGVQARRPGAAAAEDRLPHAAAEPGEGAGARAAHAAPAGRPDLQPAAQRRPAGRAVSGRRLLRAAEPW